MKKVLALLLAVVMVIGVLAGCGGQANTGGQTGTDQPSQAPSQSQGTQKDLEPIKLGNIQDLTGSASEAGVANAWGVEYAVKMINSQGGINGRMIELYTEDCKNDATEALNAYRKLVDEIGIHALIGPPLSNSAATWKELVEEDQIPCVGHFMDESCTTDENGNVYKYMFLAEPGCIQQSYSIAKFALEKLGIKTAGVLYNTANAFAVAHAKPFMDYINAKGGKIVVEETFSWSDADYSAQAAKVAAANPDAVFLSDYAAQAKLCYQQLREAGYKGIILGANTLALPFPTLVDGEIYDLYFLQNVDMFSEGTDCYDLLQAFFKENPDSTYPKVNACFGYDAVMVMADAMRRAKDPTDGAEVQALLEQTKDVPTSSGPITIDPKTHRPVGMPMYIATYDENNNVKIVDKIFVSEDALK
ncbi:MAG: ABC transporter substrate-binding protein [Clostridiaceae bacterium]|nr:ABC transporter substrate-binding protein [Clostridiaceae bacterium]